MNKQRLEKQRLRSAERRANMTKEEKDHEKASTKRRVAKYRSNRTPEKVANDNKAAREGMRSLRDSFSKQEKDARIEFRRQHERGSDDPGEHKTSVWYLLRMHRRSCLLSHWLVKKYEAQEGEGPAK